MSSWRSRVTARRTANKAYGDRAIGEHGAVTASGTIQSNSGKPAARAVPGGLVIHTQKTRATGLKYAPVRIDGRGAHVEFVDVRVGLQAQVALRLRAAHVVLRVYTDETGLVEHL